jgi:lia operon protein LiaG
MRTHALRSPVRRLVLGAAALALALPALAGSASAQQAVRRSLAGDDIGIWNIAGSIRVEAGTGSEVTVEVTPRGRDAARLRVESGRLRGRETLRVIYPDRRIVYPERRGSSRMSLQVNEDGTFFDDHGDDRDNVQVRSSGDGLEAWADVVVRMPRGRRVAVYIAAGQASATSVEGDLLIDAGAVDITTADTKGSLRLDTGSGRTRVTRAEGDVELDAGSGDAELTDIRGRELRMDTGSGRVTVNGATSERLELDTGSGSLRLSNVRSPVINLDTGSGSVELGLAADVESLRIDSGSGGVTIGVPEALGAEFRIETGSGGIDFDFPVQIRRQSRGYMAGIIGDGKGEIVIETGSGGIRFLRR